MKSRELLASAAACLVVSLGGCVTTGFSAAQSANPVLLGPVTAIGTPSAPGAPSQPFASKSTSNLEYYVGIDSSGRGRRRQTTVSGESSTTSTSPQQGDLDVLVATSGDPVPRIAVHRLHCGGTELNVFYLYLVADSWCETTGDVYRPAPVAAPPPASASAEPAGPATSSPPNTPP